MDSTGDGNALETLVAQSAGVLLTMGLSAEPAAVRRVAEVLAKNVSEGSGLDMDDAVQCLTPEGVADAIARAAEGDDQAVAVRPVRARDGAVAVPPWVSGRLVMALAKIAQWAGPNGATRSQHHAFDLSVELGDALLHSKDSGLMEIHLDLLAEVQKLAEQAADRIESGKWSPCPCGQRHDGEDVPQAFVVALRSDAELAGRLLSKAEGD
ncbi:hypothetical protein [Kitasatospora sp. NPDC088346]|uniref:hypothetical protein n=1 Tax=Kitasatospora sp. NPDC088346 TaxID=3364073 RepID=UPI00380C6268